VKALLLDQGLPRSTVRGLTNNALESIHVGELEMARAKDADILDFASQNDYVIVTLDSDFHALLAARQSQGPTVIRIRIEGLKGKGLAELLKIVIGCTTEDILAGSSISVNDNGIRVRRLPLR